MPHGTSSNNSIGGGNTGNHRHSPATQLTPAAWPQGAAMQFHSHETHPAQAVRFVALLMNA